eukprot:TRINITY_DN1856_c0_g3_i1.p1 TRINITY_DN1856_c0_g3~~TRINITY_DN1856_c0_g3_i1.p1  ORF type:complete len:170 (+),score=17.29 TRINITY_DN1856_c0_g3_i1:420-929(+)
MFKPPTTPAPSTTPVPTTGTPVLIGKIDLPYVINGMDVAVSGKLVYLLTLENELRIYNATNPSLPTLVGALANRALFGLGHVMHLDDTRKIVYVGSADGLVVVDVSNPENPVRLGSVVTGTDVISVSAVGDVAPVITNDKVYVVDVSDASSPSVIGSLATNDTPYYLSI